MLRSHFPFRHLSKHTSSKKVKISIPRNSLCHVQKIIKCSIYYISVLHQKSYIIINFIHKIHALFIHSP